MAVYARPFEPTHLEPGTIGAFPLAEMARQLAAERPFRESGRSALTLVHDRTLTMVLTAARGGTTCQEHAERGPTSIVVLSGEIVITPTDSRAPIALGGGSAAALAPGIGHVITARTDSAFLTVIGPP
jgi:quercetin dioxygenase-like cupin family protein